MTSDCCGAKLVVRNGVVVCYVCDKPFFDETLRADGSKVLRSNWKPGEISKLKVSLLCVIVVFTVFVFWWYEIRPIFIKKDCAKHISIGSDVMYKKCLRENGLLD